MGDSFRQALSGLLADPNSITPESMLVRLLASVIFGAAVAWIYTHTQHGVDTSGALPTTLVLLSVLIAMVTQVIGDNVARAFSLVGALSIVRFRTVVRDTRDTAFVIFAVAVGMAAGAQNLWLAVLGLAVGGGAAFLMARVYHEAPARTEFDQVLRVRVGLGVDVSKSLAPALHDFAVAYHLMSIGTVRQGTAIEAAYEIKFTAGRTPEELVRQVNRIDGVQEIRLARKGHEEI